MRDFHIISLLSSFAIAILTLLFVLLLSIGPLEQNKPARAIVTEILNKDPKVQRNIAKGHMTDHTQTTTEILAFFN